MKGVRGRKRKIISYVACGFSSSSLYFGPIGAAGASGRVDDILPYLIFSYFVSVCFSSPFSLSSFLQQTSRIINVDGEKEEGRGRERRKRRKGNRYFPTRRQQHYQPKKEGKREKEKDVGRFSAAVSVKAEKNPFRVHQVLLKL